MKKRLLSIILTAFLVLSMVPYAAFADSSIVCPACGGSVTKQERRLLTAHDDFFKCDKCGKWAWANKLGSLNLFSVGDQQILEAADSSGLLNFSFNNGHLIPAEKAPSGIGRKDLPGYADDKGSALVDKDGWPTATYTMLLDGYDTSAGRDTVYVHSSTNKTNPGSWYQYANGGFSGSNGNVSVYCAWEGGSPYVYASVSYYYVAPVTGYYTINFAPATYFSVTKDRTGKYVYKNTWSEINTFASFGVGVQQHSSSVFGIRDNTIAHTQNFSSETKYAIKGQILFCTYKSNFCLHCNSDYPYKYLSIQTSAPTLTVQDLTPSQITNNNNITINNNTWNGNIYVDNSTNLTYIYPQYTTINEKNETVTNISNTPIIYNNETKKYYTYDTITNNYYYITYEQPTAPTPSPNPKPTWKPGGGSTRGGGTGRYPADPFTADWTLNYYILNNRRYDAYYALKRTEVDTKNNIPWIDDKHYISTTQIPIANGEYTISVPDGVYWRVWQWDEASKTLTGVNSSNWHGNNFTFLFNTTDEYIFEFCKSDGSEFSSPKDVVLKLKNEKITEYEPGDTIVEEPSPSPTPSPINPPSPSPTPAPTDKPGGGTDPTPVPTPSGGTVPAPGGDSNISGGDDEGLFGWLWDLLKDLVKAILKAIFKILSNILGFLIWIVERVGLLLPFLPAPAIAALGAGVVLIFVIRIIRFIRG